MTGKHTPGPWVATWRHPAAASDAEVVVEQAGGSAPIAICHRINTLSYEGSQTDANARLIAAAPELLTALRNVLSFFNDGALSPTVIKSARHVLAKAEGRAP